MNSAQISRRTSERESQMLPQIDPATGHVSIDPTWGTVQPMSLHPEIRTLGELEMIAHIESGGRLVDTRLAKYIDQSGSIPGAATIPWDQIADRRDELDGDDVVVLFCNGPQCAATPRAVEALLQAGFPPRRLAYYRGGIHDWVSLGYPLEPIAG